MPAKQMTVRVINLVKINNLMRPARNTPFHFVQPALDILQATTGKRG